jgi:hypothetical protein
MILVNVISFLNEPLDIAYTLRNIVNFVGKYERGKKSKVL